MDDLGVPKTPYFRKVSQMFYLGKWSNFTEKYVLKNELKPSASDTQTGFEQKSPCYNP